jgi:acetyltransferase-like isoleucine patch superfamily enzyme
MRREAAINSMIKMIPALPGGAALRHLLYRQMLHQMGRAVYIQEGVDLLGAAHLELGDHVCILQGTSMEAQAPASSIRIGNHVIIRRGVEIEAYGSARIEIGDRTFISSHVWILGIGSVSIGQDCLISPYVGIVATNRNYQDPAIPINKQGGTSKGITIEADCWLGHRVSVLDGVTIGQGSVIGAGAVVTKNIPPYSIAVGIPAKVVGSRNLEHPSLPA